MALTMSSFPLMDLSDPIARWLVICLAILTIIYAVVRPMFRRKDPLNRPSSFTSLAQQRSVERQMQNVLVELSEMARQISAQLDTRAAKLEMLIKEADQKIAALNKGSSAPAAPNGQSDEIADSAPSVDPRHARIYALADAGQSASQIAQELNQPSGEIELILALRR